MKILLISGHGAGDSGAIAKTNGKTYKEATETVIMVKKIKTQLLKYKGVSVTLYPTSRNAYEDAKKGCLKKNFKDYDYVLEVHFNACVNDLKGNGKTTGTEIYAPTADASTKTEGYIVENIAKLGLKNRGVKKSNFTVICRAYAARTQASLLETCFIDDADDMKVYIKNKDKIAQAVAKGIAKGYNLKLKSAGLQVGDKITINSGATDLNTGKKYSGFVYNTSYNVIRIDNGEKVVFGKDGVAVGYCLKKYVKEVA